MTTLFILWPAYADTAFRTAYEAATGEKIQDTPLVSPDASSFMIGSSRADRPLCAALAAALSPDIRCGESPEELGWTTLPDTPPA